MGSPGDANFEITEKPWLYAGLEQVVALQPQTVLQAGTTPDLLKLIYGQLPNIHIVAEWNDDMTTIINHRTTKHTLMGDMFVVLLRPSKEEPTESFIQRAFAATGKVTVSALRVMTTDRPIASLTLAQTYHPWVWTTTHGTRRPSAQPTYKMIPLMKFMRKRPRTEATGGDGGSK